MVRELTLPSAGSTATLHGIGRTVVVLGHGAGGTRRTPMLVALAEDLASSGRAALLYNFPYSEAGRRRPDPPAALERTAAEAAAIGLEGAGAERLVVGGRSMGGRIASQVVAAGGRADALAFFGYPLHPPGQPGKLRDAHLARIGVPMLFVQGTRDAFAREDLIQGVLARLGDRAERHLVEGADHSFGVRKSSGRTASDVTAEVRGALLDWLERQGL